MSGMHYTDYMGSLGLNHDIALSDIMTQMEDMDVHEGSLEDVTLPFPDTPITLPTITHIQHGNISDNSSVDSYDTNCGKKSALKIRNNNKDENKRTGRKVRFADPLELFEVSEIEPVALTARERLGLTKDSMFKLSDGIIIRPRIDKMKPGTDNDDASSTDSLTESDRDFRLEVKQSEQGNLKKQVRFVDTRTTTDSSSGNHDSMHTSHQNTPVSLPGELEEQEHMIPIPNRTNQAFVTQHTSRDVQYSPWNDEETSPVHSSSSTGPSYDKQYDRPKASISRKPHIMVTKTTRPPMVQKRDTYAVQRTVMRSPHGKSINRVVDIRNVQPLVRRNSSLDNLNLRSDHTYASSGEVRTSTHNINHIDQILFTGKVPSSSSPVNQEYPGQHTRNNPDVRRREMLPEHQTMPPPLEVLLGGDTPSVPSPVSVDSGISSASSKSILDKISKSPGPSVQKTYMYSPQETSNQYIQDTRTRITSAVGNNSHIEDDRWGRRVDTRIGHDTSYNYSPNSQYSPVYNQSPQQRTSYNDNDTNLYPDPRKTEEDPYGHFLRSATNRKSKTKLVSIPMDILNPGLSSPVVNNDYDYVGKHVDTSRQYSSNSGYSDMENRRLSDTHADYSPVRPHHTPGYEQQTRRENTNYNHTEPHYSTTADIYELLRKKSRNPFVNPDYR